MESCLGKDNVNKYTVNMKKAVAKCEQQDAPELDLPPFRSMYKFVNTIISSANRMDQQKLHQGFVTLRMMTNAQDYYMNDYNYTQSSDNYEMKKMMKKFFGNDHSADQYEMMEKFFKNDNQMDAFEMMKMILKFSGNEKNLDMSEMMHSMEKMYGNDYKMTNQDYNKFDMMKMANEKNFDSQDYKNYNYAPPQARFRFKRQAPESTKPHQKP